MDSLRSQCSGFPNKDQQASVGFRDPIEAQAVENLWFVLYCPGGLGCKRSRVQILARGSGCPGLFRCFMDMVNCK